METLPPWTCAGISAASRSIKVTGSKEVRAEPFAAQVQGGNVYLVAGIYQNDLLDEMVSFPNGKYRDQVDSCSGAFNRLISGPIYNLFGGALD